jgi:hypothetical protein
MEAAAAADYPNEFAGEGHAFGMDGNKINEYLPSICCMRLLQLVTPKD